MMLESIWFFLWGLLWAVYFVTDGFDLGIGMLLPFLGKDEGKRRAMYNATGPFWDGNEVWLITAGGVTFAAFPKVYAVMFSSLYAPLMLILFALIVRGVSWEFRGHIDDPRWRKLWDGCHFVGSLLPALLLGVAFANIFRGLPMDATGYHGTLVSLLNPYGLAGGVLFVVLFLLHGATWLAAKTEGDLHERAGSLAKALWVPVLTVAVLFLVGSWLDTPLYRNYLRHPALFLVVLVTVAALLGTRVFLGKAAYWKAWAASAVTIAGATFFGVIGLYPNMFPSRLDPAASLSAFNASSSPMTLTIMLVVVAIFVPIVLGYQAWVYKTFSHKVDPENLTAGEVY
ncbi:MAG: cytochrome d ubiquinol oxidase subunit II [Armatimonadetes bacterium]|nr:cytochrome d ubiquinol oxidase subunit II [Armatimonadota bacterium]